MKHIEFEKLLAKFDGLLADDESREIAAHLGECQDCTAQAAKLEKFFAYTNEAHEEVGQAVTARLLNIFQPKKTFQPIKESFAKKIFAILAFDDWQTALNERFTFSDTRQLLYKADEYDIDLRLNFIGDKCQLSGQILPDCENATLELIASKSKEIIEIAETSEFCEFSFSIVSKDIYDLRIYLKDFFIEISDISLLA
ncbi:MAG TPA: hypothetical protein PKY59_02035 [Pyrinomonadaceae bacterium]|nr:hypothetical protein [Pyrinomonadaceae bacterium]